MSALPDLMRRLDRKLDIQRGLSLTYDVKLRSPLRFELTVKRAGDVVI